MPLSSLSSYTRVFIVINRLREVADRGVSLSQDQAPVRCPGNRSERKTRFQLALPTSRAPGCFSPSNETGPRQNPAERRSCNGVCRVTYSLLQTYRLMSRYHRPYRGSASFAAPTVLSRGRSRFQRHLDPIYGIARLSFLVLSLRLAADFVLSHRCSSTSEYLTARPSFSQGGPFLVLRHLRKRWRETLRQSATSRSRSNETATGVLLIDPSSSVEQGTSAEHVCQ